MDGAPRGRATCSCTTDLISTLLPTSADIQNLFLSSFFFFFLHLHSQSHKQWVFFVTRECTRTDVGPFVVSPQLFDPKSLVIVENQARSTPLINMLLNTQHCSLHCCVFCFVVMTLLIAATLLFDYGLLAK